MAHVIRTLTRRVFICIHICIVVVYLLAIANAILPPDRWWFIAILGIAFPFLLLFVLAFFVFWLVLRSKWALLSLVALLLGLSNIRALIAFHFGGSFHDSKNDRTVRVLTWNVMWFGEQTRETKTDGSFRDDMLDFIASQHADVLCFQEYLQSGGSREATFDNDKDLARLGFSYRFFAGDYIFRDGSNRAGVAIFSRFPISDTLLVKYQGPKSRRASESLIAVDINISGQKIRVFTTHLQSVLFGKKEYQELRRIKNAEDSLVDASRSILRKLKTAYAFRKVQADTVRQLLNRSPYPEIICGDFNDIPNSYTYFRIRDNRQDAFLEKGTGVGRTFSNISSTLRIDYILADQRFRILQCQRKVVPYSDHYPVIADLQLPD